MLTTSDADKTRAAFEAARPAVRGARRGRRHGRDDDRRHAAGLTTRSRGSTEPTDAHRDLERQLAAGPAREGRVVAGARRARRPADAGDEALGRRRAASCRSRWRATSSSTTARVAGTAWRSRSATASPSTSRSRTSGTARSGTAAPARRSRSRRRTSTRSTRRGWSRCESRPRAAIRIRVVSLYAPNGRVVGSPFYAGKLKWFTRARRWLDETRDPSEALVLGGDLNVAPTDEDVWAAARAHGGTHVSEPERAGFRDLLDWGLHDSFRDLQPARDRPVHLVGLPRRQLPQELRDADRPPPADRIRSPSGWWRSRSTGRRARASRFPRTTRRSSWTSTSPASRSIPAGPTRKRESPLAEASARADRATAALVARSDRDQSAAYRAVVARLATDRRVDMERMPSRSVELALRVRRGVVAVAAAAVFAVSACAAPGGGATTAPATQAAAPATAAPGTASGESLQLVLGNDATLGSYITGRDGNVAVHLHEGPTTARAPATATARRAGRR